MTHSKQKATKIITYPTRSSLARNTRSLFSSQELLSEIEKLNSVDFKNSHAESNTSALKQLNLSKGKTLAVGIAARVLHDLPVEYMLCLEMYKSLLSQKMKALNCRAVSEQKYQC